MTKSLQIHKFWEKVNPGSNSYKGNPSFERMENEFIFKVLKQIKKGNLLDVGCGIGERTIQFAKLIDGNVTGIDYTNNMINKAKKRENRNIKFIKTDIFNFNPKEKYDIITSCRCIINTPTDEGQLEFIKKLTSLLKPKGHLIMAERSKQGMERFNKIRQSFGLSTMKERYHNHYMNEKFLIPYISRHFDILETERLGAFFFTLRFLKPLLFYKIDRVETDEQTNLSEKIQSSLGNKLDDYGMQLLWHLRKNP